MKSIEVFIKRVRQEPEHIRLRYVFGFTALGMVIMIGIWILSITQSFGESLKEDEELKKVQENIKDTGDELGNSLNGIVESFEAQGEDGGQLQQEQGISPQQEEQKEKMQQQEEQDFINERR